MFMKAIADTSRYKNKTKRINKKIKNKFCQLTSETIKKVEKVKNKNMYVKYKIM